jgi:hypothetical protein
MKNIWQSFIFVLMSPLILIGQNIDTTVASKDSGAYTETLKTLKSKGQEKVSFDIKSEYQRSPINFSDHPSHIRPTARTEYDVITKSLKQRLTLTPLGERPTDEPKPLSLHDFVLPTQEEFEVLKILWTNGDLTGSDIYSNLDTCPTIAREDLDHLLQKMTQRGTLSRKIVSPRHEFTFIVLGKTLPIRIEMDPKNLRNRQYKYHCNVDFGLMKKFIRANAFLCQQDPSVMKSKALKAAGENSAFLQELFCQIAKINPGKR